MFFSARGGVAAFDAMGNQIPNLQVSIIELWARHAESQGFNPLDFDIQTAQGDKIRLFKTEDGYNYQVH